VGKDSTKGETIAVRLAIGGFCGWGGGVLHDDSMELVANINVTYSKSQNGSCDLKAKLMYWPLAHPIASVV
jgi:hypothetical protein